MQKKKKKTMILKKTFSNLWIMQFLEKPLKIYQKIATFCNKKWKKTLFGIWTNTTNTSFNKMVSEKIIGNWNSQG